MNREELKRLLGRYYSGESTGEEENNLREYFRRDDIPEGYDTEKIIFGFYTTENEIPEPSQGFEARLIESIDAYENKHVAREKRRFIFSFMSVAAGILILVASYFLVVQTSKSQDTFKDPHIAYAETMKILMDVSSRLNRGTQSLEPVGRINKIPVKSFNSMNRPSTLIEKNMKNLEHLKKAIKIINVPDKNEKLNNQ